MATTQRRLTTILSADVEGYSRLMGIDEEGTFATLKAYREVINAHVSAYDGRVVNTWGDGLLADFPSVVSAVRAAIDIQGELGERNAGMPPEMRMHYRIGINLGDVIVDGEDLYGDGVNIAARLQSEAAPGGILVSSSVYDQVRTKLSVGFEFLGNLSVKNIKETVPTFSVRMGGQDDGPPPPARHPEVRQPAREPESAVARVTAPAGVNQPLDRRWLVLAVVPVGLLAVNALSWQGNFWAAWPLLVFAALGALAWARRTTLLDRGLAVQLVAATVLVAINLLTWTGYFWAVWPILAIAIGGVLRFVARGRSSQG